MSAALSAALPLPSLLADAAGKLLPQLTGAILLQGVGALSLSLNLNGEGGGDDKSGVSPAEAAAVVTADNAIGVKPHDPCVGLGAPGRHGPFKALRQRQDVMVLADLIQGERGHLALTDAVLFGAVEGGEVHSAGDDLIGVAVRDAPQIGVIEVELQVAVGKVVGVAKGEGRLVQVQH